MAEEQREVKIGQLQPGMRVAKIVENKFGASLVTPGMILDEKLIEKLKNLGIDTITIFDESEETFQENIDNFSLKYKNSVNSIKNIFKSITYGNQLNYDDVKGIIEQALHVDTNRDVVSMLTKMRDVDNYTYIHSVNVGFLGLMLGRWLNLPEKEVKMLVYAGFLHDIGKARVPQEIINKKGKLTPEEFKEMKKHTVYGYRLIKECEYLPKKVASGVLFHHERIDGSGYPLGLKKEKIPFIARALAIIDTFDAMTSDRVYRGHYPPFQVFKFFEETFQSYDITLSKIFIRDISKYYIGEKVELSNGQKAEIVFINPNHLSQPIVRVGSKYIDLYESDNLHIKDLVFEARLDKDHALGDSSG